MSYSRKKTEYWRGILSQYVASGLRPVEFCRARGLAAKSFYKWRLRLRAELSAGAFAPAPAACVARQTAERLELVPVMSGVSPHVGSTPEEAPGAGSGVSIEAGGVRVHVATGFDKATLRCVLEVVGGLPC